jgi:hypothetical protein
MIGNILKSISKRMLDKKYKESEKLFKNKDFKGALKIYEELKDTEYYPKIKDNYDRCLKKNIVVWKLPIIAKIILSMIDHPSITFEEFDSETIYKYIFRGLIC